MELGPWYLVGGTKMLNALPVRDESPLSRLNEDEHGDRVATGVNVWTGFRSNVAVPDLDAHLCQDWESAAASNQGRLGTPNTDHGWMDATAAPCNESHRIYCFEQ